MQASELQHWIASYNAVGIKAENQPPKAIYEAVSNCAIAVCSDLPRSIESAQALGVPQFYCAAPLFREAGLPYAEWRFPKLPPTAWAALFRILWLAGFSRNSESLSHAKERALKATEKLESLAYAHGSVALIGHGMLNRFIAKNLLSSGWQGPSNPGKRYWEFGVYEQDRGIR